MTVHTETAQHTSGPVGGSAPESTASRTTRRALLVGTPVLAGSLMLGTPGALAAPPTLRKGDKGKNVKKLQKDLNALKYWCGSADGSFGATTEQAVYALQKAAGLGVDGVVGAKSHKAIGNGVKPKPKITSGSAFEIDKDKQLMYFIRKGKLMRIFNTSTGSGKEYTSGDGSRKRATTPNGDYKIGRMVPGWETAPLGRMYRPAYYDRGWAIHGSNSIPPYPASHGCARLSVAATDHLYSKNWIKKGRRVLVHGKRP